ncbi:ankyrin [Wilcoxina mikolae CBS 423.85]|nr:ankyrin [Wilcoxina mikolae CBS 423.85]
MIDVSVRLRRGIHADNLLIVKRILKNNPKSVFNPDLAGNTSLHLAAQFGRLSIVRYFVEVADHECDGVSKNNAGDTPLMVAAAEGHEEVVHFLATRFQESLNWRNRLGVTALMVAAMAGRDGIVNVCFSHSSPPPPQYGQKLMV